MNGTSQIFSAVLGLMNLILLIVPPEQRRSRIDDLQTGDEVRSFVMQTFPDYGDFKLMTMETFLENINCSEALKDSDLRSWQKLDLNNDGFTDLLITTDKGYQYQQIAIISQGTDAFELKLVISMQNCEFVKPILLKQKNYLEVRRIDWEGTYKKLRTPPRKFIVDTLTYKFSNFIEYNQKPAKKIKFDHISIFTTGCEGECPSFTMFIHSDGRMNFDGKYFCKVIGEATGNLPKKQLTELYDILSYIDVNTLKANYSYSATDNPQITFKVFYKDGSSKTISDYGFVGNYGLKVYYSKIMTIAAETSWKQ